MRTNTYARLCTVCLKCFTYDSWPITVVGNIPELGNWDAKSALPMQLEAEVNGCREWKASIQCPFGQAFEFKFVKNSPLGPSWEAGENRPCCPSDRWMGIADEFRGQELYDQAMLGELAACA